jgi:hypothetical protein
VVFKISDIQTMIGGINKKDTKLNNIKKINKTVFTLLCKIIAKLGRG